MSPQFIQMAGSSISFWPRLCLHKEWERCCWSMRGLGDLSGLSSLGRTGTMLLWNSEPVKSPPRWQTLLRAKPSLRPFGTMTKLLGNSLLTPESGWTKPVTHALSFDAAVACLAHCVMWCRRPLAAHGIGLWPSNKDVFAAGPDGTHPFSVAGWQRFHQLHLPGLGITEQHGGPGALLQVVKDVPCLGKPWH